MIESGSIHGRLTVIKKTSGRKYLCQCSCGTIKEIVDHRIKSGETISCGCYRIEKRRQDSFQHGLTGTRPHRVWTGMMTRCYNPNFKGYKHYGGRGIAVCPEWHNFEKFYADMGWPSDGLSIDRIDVNKGYSPDNCRWATDKEQQNNRRPRSVIPGARVEFRGSQMRVSEVAKILGVSLGYVYRRVNAGVPLDA